MRRLLPLCRLLWEVVVLASVVGMGVNALSSQYFAEAYAVLAAHYVLIAEVLLLLGCLTLLAWLDSRRQTQAERDEQRRQCFALCKPAADVRLDDLDPYDRPQYPYVPRTAVPYEHRSAAAPP